ncbi:hypothetical protein C8R46DRAFT_1213332 [Mycena filopes]|nr:hypothetical protein C8R46DRAFT_1213332 [Mycena filopes]
MFGSAAAIDLGLPFFRNVTHMDLFNSCVDQQVWIMPALAALPALTHLGLTESDVAFLCLVLEQLPRLQVLAVTMEDGDPGGEIPPGAPVSDPRFVVVVNGHYWVDWEIGVLGGMDFWAAADLFVARKRKGEIDVHAGSILRVAATMVRLVTTKTGQAFETLPPDFNTPPPVMHSAPRARREPARWHIKENRHSPYAQR